MQFRDINLLITCTLYKDYLDQYVDYLRDRNMLTPSRSWLHREDSPCGIDNLHASEAYNTPF